MILNSLFLSLLEAFRRVVMNVIFREELYRGSFLDYSHGEYSLYYKQYIGERMLLSECNCHYNIFLTVLDTAQNQTFV